MATTSRPANFHSFASAITAREISSGKTENDFAPQKGAFEQINAIVADIQERRESLKDDIEQLGKLQIDSDGSEGATTLINKLKKKIENQMKEIEQLLEKAQGLSTTANEDPSIQLNGGDDESGNDNPVSTSKPSYMTAGAQTQAAVALLELQELWTEMQKLRQQFLQSSLANSTGIVAAVSHAAQDSMTQEANNQRLEMGSHIGQALMSGASAGYTTYSRHNLAKESAGDNATLGNLQQHKAALDTARPARPVVGDRPDRDRPLLERHENDQVHDRVEQFTDKSKFDGYVEVQDGAAYQHIASHRASSQTVSDNLNRQITSTTERLTLKQTTASALESRFSSFTQLAGSAEQAVIKGLEANNTMLKGADEAQRSVGQDTGEKLNQYIQSNRDAVQDDLQQGRKAVDIREQLLEKNSRRG